MCTRDVACKGVEVGWVRYGGMGERNTLRWFCHVDRMENEDFVKKVYLSSVEGPNRKGRPLERWEDKVKEYLSEKGVRGNGLEWARRECMDTWIGKGGGPPAVATPLGTLPEGVRRRSY